MPAQNIEAVVIFPVVMILAALIAPVVKDVANADMLDVLAAMLVACVAKVVFIVEMLVVLVAMLVVFVYVLEFVLLNAAAEA